MKTIISPIIFLAIISLGLIKGDKKKKFLPPGTVKISETIYFDETEITNFSWCEYVNWKKIQFGDSSPEYLGSLPDTTVWLDSSAYNLPYVNYYFRHAAYRDYPVVGISYEQVIDFCKWRTERVREVLNKKRFKKYIPKNFQYRLPTRAEWELVAKAGYSTKTQRKLDKKFTGYYKSNFKRIAANNTEPSKYNPDVTAPVYSYWENSYGLWQITGNVAEMTSEKGLAKGGSWCNRENEATIEKVYHYNGPKSWLGFRCVCEIIEP